MLFDRSTFWVIRLDRLADAGDTRVEIGKPAESWLSLHGAHNLGQGQLIFALVQPPFEVPHMRAERREDDRQRRDCGCGLSSVEQAPIAIRPDEVKGHRAERVPGVTDYFLAV